MYIYMDNTYLYYHHLVPSLHDLASRSEYCLWLEDALLG